MLLKDCYIGDVVKIDGLLADGCNTEFIRKNAHGIVITKDKYNVTLKNTSGWDPSWHDDKDIGYIESYDRIFVVNNTCNVTLIKPVEKDKTIKGNEETKMKDVKIVDYKVCDNDGVKTVVVEFEDGVKEHAVCCKEDVFELERGIEVCVLKYILGFDNYKYILRESMKQVRLIDKTRKEAAEKAEKEKELINRKKAKAARRKERSRAKRRAERVSEMKEAYLKAMNEYNKTHILDSDIIDDLK